MVGGLSKRSSPIVCVFCSLYIRAILLSRGSQKWRHRCASTVLIVSLCLSLLMYTYWTRTSCNESKYTGLDDCYLFALSAFVSLSVHNSSTWQLLSNLDEMSGKATKPFFCFRDAQSWCSIKRLIYYVKVCQLPTAQIDHYILSLLFVKFLNLSWDHGYWE